MFSKKIIDSDAFLDMPLSAQALYFHLNMRADDDGFINNPKRIQRITGASDDDFKLLLAKRFIIFFDSGVIVIKHWWMHNTLKSDRYKPTQYQEERALLCVKENKSYTVKAPDPPALNGTNLEPDWNQFGTRLEPQYRLDKDKIKDRIDKNNNTCPSGDVQEADFEAFWKVYPKKVAKKKAYQAFKKIKTPVSVLIEAVEKQKKSEQWMRDHGQYIPFPTTWLNQERWIMEDDVEPPQQQRYDGITYL